LVRFRALHVQDTSQGLIARFFDSRGQLFNLDSILTTHDWLNAAKIARLAMQSLSVPILLPAQEGRKKNVLTQRRNATTATPLDATRAVLDITSQTLCASRVLRVNCLSYWRLVFWR
jgi:hypothetical protein